MQKKFEYTKDDTIIMKGIAVLLMIFYHFFHFPDRISSNGYISLFKVNNMPIEYYISDFGQICIGIFVFLSGFGLYYSFSKKEVGTWKAILKRIFNFLVSYWVIVIIFALIKYPILKIGTEFNLKEFVFNFFGITNSYCGEWWFVGLYIELLLLLPVIKKLFNKLSNKKMLSLIFGLFFLTFGFKMCCKMNQTLSKFSDNDFVEEIINLLYWLPSFMLGYYFAKNNVFKNWYEKLQNSKFYNKKFVFISIGLIIIIRSLAWIFPLIVLKKELHATYIDIFIVPIFIFLISLTYKRPSKFFLFIGNNSKNMWLIHTPLCYYLFPNFICMPRFSILIYLFLVSLTIIISVIIDKLVKLFLRKEKNEQ